MKAKKNRPKSGDFASFTAILWGILPFAEPDENIVRALAGLGANHDEMESIRIASGIDRRRFTSAVRNVCLEHMRKNEFPAGWDLNAPAQVPMHPVRDASELKSFLTSELDLILRADVNSATWLNHAQWSVHNAHTAAAAFRVHPRPERPLLAETIPEALSQIQELLDAVISANFIENRADIENGTPEFATVLSPDVNDLIEHLKRNRKSGKSAIELARIFVGNIQDREKKAAYLLRSARRHKHRWK